MDVGADRGGALWGSAIGRVRFAVPMLALLAACGLAAWVAATASAFPENCNPGSGGLRSCSGTATDSFPTSVVCQPGTATYWEDSNLPNDAQGPKLTSVSITPDPPCSGATVTKPTVQQWPASNTDPDGRRVTAPKGKEIFRFTWTVNVPNGSSPIAPMNVKWSISWTVRARTKTAQCPDSPPLPERCRYDLAVHDQAPKLPDEYKVGDKIGTGGVLTVVNNGPAVSPPAKVTLAGDVARGPHGVKGYIALRRGSFEYDCRTLREVSRLECNVPPLAPKEKAGFEWIATVYPHDENPSYSLTYHVGVIENFAGAQLIVCREADEVTCKNNQGQEDVALHIQQLPF